MRLPNANYTPIDLLSFVAVALLLLLAGGGCARTRIYKASELPASLQAPVLKDPTSINLGSLTPPQNRSDAITPGCSLLISVAAGLDHESNADFHVRVLDDGTVRLPEIGSVQLAGQVETQAEEYVAATLVQRGYYQHPAVSVRIERWPTNKITVVGAVKNPGTHELRRTASYLGVALVTAGGFTEKAGTKIQIARFNRGAQTVDVDLADDGQLSRAGEYLEDGAVVTVEKRDLPPVQVQGLVTKPGEVDFPSNRQFRLTNAISAAGGESNDLADSVLVQRQLPDGHGVALIRVSLTDAMHSDQENIRLAPGDAVRVERTPSTFAWELVKRVGIALGGTVPLLK